MFSEKKKEIKLASDIQKSLLPLSIDKENIVIEGFYRSLHSVSGDIYHWIEVEPDVYVVFLADVVGHGVGSGLMTTSIIATISNLILEEKRPDILLKNLNNHIMELFKSKDLSQINYFTAVYMVINLNEGTVNYSNCGHPAILRIEGNKVETFSQRNLPIGLFNNVDFTYGTFKIEKGMKILVVTDGIIEMSHLEKKHVSNLVELVDEYLGQEDINDILEYIDRTRITPNESMIEDDIAMISITL